LLLSGDAHYIHAYFGNETAKFSIPDGDLLAGQFPRKQTRLVQAWIELHQEELLADCSLVMNGENPFHVEPLR
jgi:hypothetical protein